ncbi:hypothetical protein DK28_0211320 [Peptococcaceae bacterium SCADC1_2_3]|jgi:phosphonate metabolism transcriptional regulator PhnF|nr:hypothetical protein DK28_0211320 [Peptococcaceae bacterium SCADC1_2_3]KFI36122.1 hypothetical protein HY00_07535 [Peptococcaceae bacterium SCADC1_2_3]
MEVIKIDKRNGIPYYLQLASILGHQIEKGGFLAGDKLPSEKELSAVYRVNRHTVRQAIGELVFRGLAYREKGRGTFVCPPAREVVHYRYARRHRFTQNILELGLTPEAKVLQVLETLVPPQAAEKLRLSPTEKVVILEILRFASHAPFCLSTVHIPALSVFGLPKRIKDFTSLYELLEKAYGLKPVRLRSVFHAAFPSTEDALALQVPVDQPILKVESLMITEDGIPVEYSLSRFRSDRCKISVDFI